jgi:hypothetical protein
MLALHGVRLFPIGVGVGIGIGVDLTAFHRPPLPSWDVDTDSDTDADPEVSGLPQPAFLSVIMLCGQRSGC